MNKVEELVDIAVLGKQVEIFLESRVGSYLMQKASKEEVEALNRLRTVAATDRVAITHLQNMAWRASSIKDWLSEAVIAGLSATEVLDDRDEGNE